MTKALTATIVVTVGAAVVSAFAYTVVSSAATNTPLAGSATAAGSGTTQAPGQVKKTPTPTPTPSPSKTPPAEPAPKSLRMSPSPLTVTGLAPGISLARTLTVFNENNQDVVLQSVVATVINPSPAPTNGLSCTSPADFEVILANVTPVDVKKNSSKDVPVTIRMNNSATRNQDACKGRSFTFSLSATATSK